MNVIIADNICRIDLQIKQMMKSSDGKLIPTPEKSTLSLLYDKSVISDEEIKKLIETDVFKYDKRVLLLPTMEADKLKTVFNVQKIDKKS